MTASTRAPRQSPLNSLFNQLNLRIFYTVFSALAIVAGTYVAIQYAKGNFRFTKQGYVASTGLLNANSFPTGAEVLIDQKLVTATDDTIYLEPKKYTVSISKDGYSTWQKNLIIEPQLVTQTNAMLFPTTPSLSPLTFNGVSQISPSPDGQKLLFLVASSSSKTIKDGLYVLDLINSGPASLILSQKAPRIILESSPLAQNLTEAEFIWSPDSSEILVSNFQATWLISADKKATQPELVDVSWKKTIILTEWEHEMYLRERQLLAKFPPEILAIATQSAKNVYLSPDKKRLLYTATAAATIPTGLIPPVPATNTQTENRQLEPGKLYVYDREEDKNFVIATSVSDSAGVSVNKVAEKRLLANDLANSVPRAISATESGFNSLQATSSSQTALNFATYHSPLLVNTVQWFPDSRHLLFIRDEKIEIMEYDSTNLTTLYSGPFAQSFTYPWPDGSRLIILTSFSPDSPLNLYAIELK